MLILPSGAGRKGPAGRARQDKLDGRGRLVAAGAAGSNGSAEERDAHARRGRLLVTVARSGSQLESESSLEESGAAGRGWRALSVPDGIRGSLAAVATASRRVVREGVGSTGFEDAKADLGRGGCRRADRGRFLRVTGVAGVPLDWIPNTSNDVCLLAGLGGKARLLCEARGFESNALDFADPDAVVACLTPKNDVKRPRALESAMSLLQTWSAYWVAGSSDQQGLCTSVIRRPETAAGRQGRVLKPFPEAGVASVKTQRLRWLLPIEWLRFIAWDAAATNVDAHSRRGYAFCQSQGLAGMMLDLW